MPPLVCKRSSGHRDAVETENDIDIKKFEVRAEAFSAPSFFSATEVSHSALIGISLFSNREATPEEGQSSSLAN